MNLYEVTHVEGCVSYKTILKAHNEVEAIKTAAIRIQPHASRLILKLEGDIAKIRETLLMNFEICLIVEQLEKKQLTNKNK